MVFFKASNAAFANKVQLTVEVTKKTMLSMDKQNNAVATAIATTKTVTSILFTSRDFLLLQYEVHNLWYI